MTIAVERSFEVVFVDADEICGVSLNSDGMHHYYVRGQDVSRTEFRAWLDAKDDEARRLIRPHFFSVHN